MTLIWGFLGLWMLYSIIWRSLLLWRKLFLLGEFAVFALLTYWGSVVGAILWVLAAELAILFGVYIWIRNKLGS